MRKFIIIIMIMSIVASDILPLTASADRYIDDQSIKVNNSQTVNVDGGSSGGGSSTNDTSIPGMDSGESGGGATGSNVQSSTNVTVNVTQNVEVEIGTELELSAHLIESVQGLNRGTYIPNFDTEKGLKTLETDFASLTEYRNFNSNNKRDSIFTQTKDGDFSLDYVEALNWLYSNNYIHRFEDISFKHEDLSDERGDENVVSSNTATGGQPENNEDLELPVGSYTLKYDMYSVPDSLVVTNEDGEELASTGGRVSGTGELEFRSNGGKITVTTNEGNGLDGTYWYYEIIAPDNEMYMPKDITEVSLSETAEKDEFFFPKKGTVHNTIKKKDYIMQLMKVVDGVEESRPLMFESRYETFDLATGARGKIIGYLPVLDTQFKDHIGATGIEIGVNKLDVDFNKYAMFKYYANPNVYELYLGKAFNSGIINYNELANTPFKKSALNEFTFATNACHNSGKDTDSNANTGVVPTVINPLDYMSQDDLDAILDNISEMYQVDLDSYELEYTLDASGNINVSFKDLEESEDVSEIEVVIPECNEEQKEEEEVAVNSNSETDYPSLSNVVASTNNFIPKRSVIETAEGEESEEEEEKIVRSESKFDASLVIKRGTPVPSWSNFLGPVKVNTLRSIDNDGEFNVIHDSGVFGSSWSNPFEDSISSHKITGKLEYNKDFKYFEEEELSYIEAVMYAYRAINAYADEKLPQREVDIIMSMFSVNYGSLAENEINALNYLIAKGIIDGDNAAKYTSTQQITVEDAIILTYRIANPSARLTFKTTFGEIDEIMLNNGYAQSKTSLTEFEGSLPNLEVASPEPTEYYVIMNNFLLENDYGLSHAKHVKELDGNIKEEVEEYSSKQLADLGLRINKGEYTVMKYEVPWDINIQKLGFMHTSNDAKLPDWIELPLGGGFYLIDEDTLSSGIEELSFTRVIPDYSSEVKVSAPLTEIPEEEDKGFFASIFDKVSSVFSNDEDEKEQIEEPEVENDTVIDGNGNLKQKDNGDIPDDNDPLGILNFANQQLQSLHLESYKDDGDDKEKDKKVYIAVNSSAKANLLFDGHSLFKGGEINKEIVSSVKDVESIKLLDAMPKDDRGQALFSDETKTFLEFTFPATNRRSINELKSLIQRRLTLTGESEIKDEDISSYTGTANGQTMISRKELSMFGVVATKDAPDILYHAGTGTYAYLNTEKSYALISNTVRKFPENSVMIEINADEIYYNVEVVMSMMNSNHFYLFNGEGKYQIVSSLSNIELEPILNPSTGAHIDNTFVADVNSYKSERDKSLTDKGKYINISTVSETPATFFMTMNDDKKQRRIYGFEPYYVKSASESNNHSVNIDEVTDDLSKRNVDILFVENVLINNALVRQEFFVPKSETFLYVDNAIKVTELTEEKSSAVHAEKYLEFIENLYNNISVSDIRSEALIFKDANSYYANSKFELEDLLNRANFERGEEDKVKKLIELAKKGNKTDAKAFWILYFMGKFSIEMPKEEGQNNPEDSINKFKQEVIKQFSKKYKFSNGFVASTMEDFNILDMEYVTETDIEEKRRYEVKRIYPVNLGAFMTTDEEIYINTNRAVYLKLANKNGGNVTYVPSTPVEDTQMKSLELKTYMNNGDTSTLTTSQLNALEFQRDIIGNSFYLENGKLYNPQITYYTSLPQGRKPLRNLPKGSIFTITTATGAEKMVVLDNAYLDANGDLMVKVAKVNLKKFDKPFTALAEDQLVEYYTDEEIYKQSLNSIGEFVRAVNRNAVPLDRILKPTDLSTGTGKIYFNYANKRKGVGYKLLASSTRSVTPFIRDFIMMDKNTNSTNIEPTLSTARVSYYDTINLRSNLKIPTANNTNLPETVTTVEEVLVYESFLFNYGSVSVDLEGYAKLDIRSDYVLNTSPVVTDLVNQLVKQVVRDGVDADVKRVGDLISGDKLMISDGSQTSESLMLIKTDTADHKGHSHLVSAHTMKNEVTPSFINHSSSLLIANSELFDSVKIWAGGQRLPLYNFIGNRELNLAKPNDIEKYKNSISLVSVSGESKILVETKNGNSVSAKKFVYTGSSNGTSFTTAEVKSLTDDEKEEPFSYVLSLYLDSNLLVKLHENGYYVIDGYGSDGLVNTSAFSSRASRFEGIKNSLLTVLPTYSSVDGKFLGFDLTALELKTLKDLFNTEWWSKLLENLVVNIEIILSAFGFYYVYALMVLVVLTRSLTGVFQAWSNKLLKLITLGRLDVEEIKLRSFIPKAMFVLVLLTFTYSGAVREIILFTEEIRKMFMEIFIYPFTK